MDQFTKNRLKDEAVLRAQDRASLRRPDHRWYVPETLSASRRKSRPALGLRPKEGLNAVVSTADPGTSQERVGMRFGHLHAAVRDLPGGLDWLSRVWDVRPSFQNAGMAVVSLYGASLILDAADEDGPVTIGFRSDDCDEDYRLAFERGAETLEAPENRAWGVRAAYIRGPGRITFEIEQDLSQT